MDRRKLRRLLASSSFAALLVAAEQVRGQDLTNPAGSVGTFLQVTAADVFDDVINFGTLLGGGAPEVGIEVEGGGTVDGRVSNDGLIDIDNTNQATGIRMDGSGGFVGEGIHNHGLIDIDVSGTGTGHVARGIAVEGSNNVVLGGVDNDDGGIIDIFLRASSFVNGTAKAKASASGGATGIFVGNDVTLSGGVTNAALIDVAVSNVASAIASDNTSAAANANVRGSAFGVFLTAANLDGGFQNLNTGTIEASVSNRATARAFVATGLGEAAAEANGRAAGIHVDSLTVTGGVLNDGALVVSNRQVADAQVSAAGFVGGTASAQADARAKASGVHVAAQFLGPDADGVLALENDGEIFFVNATATGRALASGAQIASMAGTAQAAAEATAMGIHLDVDSVVGGFENEGLVDVRAFANANAKAVVGSLANDAAAEAIAQNGRALALGVLAEGDRITDDFRNTDEIYADATLTMVAVASAVAAKNATAVASVSQGLAEARGISLEYDTVLGDVHSAGVVEVRAVANISASALAKGGDDATATATAQSITLEARGIDLEVELVTDDITNDGRVSAEARLLGGDSVRAIATGVEDAEAQAEWDGIQLTAIAYEIDAETVLGDIVNDGDLRAVAQATLAAFASANAGSQTGEADAKADDIEILARGLDVDIDDTLFGDLVNNGSAYAAAVLNVDVRALANSVGDDADADATVEDVELTATAMRVLADNDVLLGSVTNNGNLTAIGQINVSGSNIVKAFAKGTDATVEAHWEDISIDVAGLVLEAETLGGSFNNAGSVQAWATARIHAEAQASGTDEASATASAETIALEARGIDVEIETVGGSLINEGGVSALALLLGGNSVRAVATGESAEAQAEWDEIELTAIAYAIDVETVFGGIVNQGSLRAVAEANLVALAQANAVGEAGEADAKADDIELLARGLDIEIDDFLADDLVNSGDAYAAAVLTVSVEAVAFSPGDEADADATAEDVDIEATALRVIADNDTLFGSVTNSGNLTAIGRINGGRAVAFASGTDATAEALWEDISIEVKGLVVEAETLGGNFNNAGSVDARITASIHASAWAIGTDEATATATAQSIALEARGIDLEIETVGGSLINEGGVSALALLLGGNSVRAVATGESAEAQAEWDEIELTAIAYEIDVETVFGSIVNEGSLRAVAQADLVASAFANAVSETGEADASVDDVSILARGLDVEIDDFLQGSLVNSGNAYAAAVLNVEALASALSTDDDADADATVEDIELAATALRVLADNDTIFGSVTNSGNLTAIGRINAEVSTVKAHANGTDATAVALWEDIFVGVNGLYLDAETLGGSFNNAGSVQAFATARIHTLATAVGTDEAGATATAQSITLDARGLNLEIETVGGSLVNEGSVSVQAWLLDGSVRAAATGESAEAQAEWDEIELTAIAYEIDVETVFGSIVNEGSLRAVAQADLAASAFANAVSETGEADARVDDVDLLARGLDVEIDDFLQGSLVNSGNAYAAAVLNVEALASALSTDDDADADATVEDIELAATALRVLADNDTIFGSVTNSGNLTAIGRINAEVSTVKAHANGTDATAVALWEDIFVDVNGLYLEVETLGGSFNNAGSVQAFATARIHTLATAVGTDEAKATATAQSITLDARGLNLEIETVGGSLVNEGSVSVLAWLRGGDTVKATATGESAEAQAEWDEIELTAIGYEIDADTIFGGILNAGTLSAVAQADLGAFAFARAGSEAGEADAKVDDVDLLARGFDVEIEDFLQGNLVNSGNASAAAILTVEASAVALSKGSNADADATVEDIDLSATGLRIIADNDDILGSVTNSGNLTAVGRINDETSSVKARASGNTSATAEARWEDISIDVTGLHLEVDFLGGGFRNAGSVLALASAHLVATAFARAVNARALAVVDDVDVTASGLHLEIETTSGGITNSGRLDVRADIDIVLNVDAVIPGVAGTATASVLDIDAKAYGLRVDDGSTLGGGIANSAFIRAIAEIDVSAEATVTGIVRVLIDDAKAKAIGLWVEDVDTVSGGIFNSGTLLVQADVFARGGASPTGANRDVDVIVQASAYGIRMDGVGSTLNGGMLNNGVVQVLARATAVASGVGALQHAEARAKAYGMYLEIAQLNGDMRNDGTLNVDAIALAVALNTVTATAKAYGMYASVTGLANGSVINDGIILVNATANAPALAVGQAVVAGTFTGSLVNATNGFHDIFASDPGTATALGLAIQGGAIMQGGVVNAGTVRVEAIGANAFARAIDVFGAGAGHRIQMLDGLLVAITRTSAAAASNVATAVYMSENGSGDTLDWSGGLIEANIIGDMAFDVMNVIAGKDDTFNHEFLIDGLLELNVNTAGQAATPVEFRIGGTALNIDDLNVNENGTLVVGANPTGPEAKISALEYTQDPDGRVLFELLPGLNNNGRITVNTANLTGIVGIRPLAGLYANTESYLAIDYVTRNGAFTGVQNTPLLQVEPLYDLGGSDVTLQVTRVPFDQVPGLTENQNELSEALEDFYDPVALLGTEIGDEVVAELFALWTEDEYLDALDDLHGAEHAQMAYAGFQAMEFLLGGVNQRLHDGRSVSSGGGQSATLGNQSLQYAQIRSGDEGITGTQLAAVGNSAGQPGSVWGKGFGSFGSLDGDKEAPGYDRTTGAIVVGVDYRIDEQFLIGLVGAYAFSSIDFDDGDDGDIDSWQIGLFGSWDSGTWYVDGLVSYAFQSYETTRHIDFIDAKAEGDYDGGAVQVYGEVGYQFQVGQQGLITPLVGLGWTNVWTDDFTETGAGGANLRVDEARYESLATTLGIRGSLALDGWEPSLFLGWRHEFLDDHGEADVAFAAVPGSEWKVIGSDIGSDAGLVGVGLVAEISQQLEATIDYGGQFSGSGSNHTGSIGLRLKF